MIRKSLAKPPIFHIIPKVYFPDRLATSPRDRFYTGVRNLSYSEDFFPLLHFVELLECKETCECIFAHLYLSSSLLIFLG